MAIEKEQHKSEIENIINRLTATGVQVDEKEKKEIEHKFRQLVAEYRVQSAEAIRTVTQAMLRKHGIATKYWGGAGKAPVIKIDQVKADNEWLSLKGKIVQIWENRSDKVARTGLIGDETGVIKITIFAKNKDIIPEDFTEGNSYLFENLVSSVWQAQVNVNANKTTTITPCDDVDARRRTETLTGVITAISSGSGLIKRCPECSRALIKGACGEHGKVEGKYDLRIKAVFSPFGKNEQLIDLIIGTEPTEALTGLSVAEAKEIATESLDAAVIEDRFRKEIVGRYYEVTGSMLDNGMLVESIRPVCICSQEALADALKEAGAGGTL